ncbi:hypothetical protein TNCV_4162541 [Trichonephila clavipes]|nr:hypothetical protein TNCV_4162541 [Trichonephila clavipes]
MQPFDNIGGNEEPDGNEHKKIAPTDTMLEGRQRLPRLAPDVVNLDVQFSMTFSQHLWPYIGNNTANVVFQMVKRLWLIHIDQ